jgi:hypothetical protein
MAVYTHETRLISQDSATLVLTGLSLQDDVIEPFPLALCCQTLSWVEADTVADLWLELASSLYDSISPATWTVRSCFAVSVADFIEPSNQPKRGGGRGGSKPSSEDGTMTCSHIAILSCSSPNTARLNCFYSSRVNLGLGGR